VAVVVLVVESLMLAIVKTKKTNARPCLVSTLGTADRPGCVCQPKGIPSLIPSQRGSRLFPFPREDDSELRLLVAL